MRELVGGKNTIGRMAAVLKSPIKWPFTFFTFALEEENWNIEYTWIKAHAGHYRNEHADKFAKEAARNSATCYYKIPKSEIEDQEREKSIEK